MNDCSSWTITLQAEEPSGDNSEEEARHENDSIIRAGQKLSKELEGW